MTPLTNPNEPTDRMINIPAATAVNPRVSSGAGSGSNEPITIHNHLHLNERGIPTIITKVAGNKLERHFR